MTAVASHPMLQKGYLNSCKLFTRRVSVVISEACFIAVSGGGHDAA